MQQKKIHLVLAVLATGIMSFSGVLIETAMNVTFPTLIMEFQVTTAMVQWVTTIYLLIISIMVPLANYLLKKFTLRQLFLAANLFFLVGLLTDFLAPNFSILLVGRVLQGVSTGIALPLMFNIILTYTPLKNRGAMMGLGTMTTSIAPAIGPTYGGILTSALSWHYIFLFLIPLMLVSLVLGLYAIPTMAVHSSAKLDWQSLLALGIFFCGALIFLSYLSSWLGWIALAIAIVGLIVYLQRAKNVAEPLVNLAVLKKASFSTFLFGFLVCQFLLLGISFILPNFLQVVLGQDAFIAGLVMLPGATVGALLAPFSGRLLDNIGAKKPIIIGFSLSAMGWLALALLLKNPILWGFVAAHVTYMIGSGLCYSNLMTTGMNSLSEKDYGDGNTLFNTLQQFSGAVSTAIVASIIDLAQASQTDYQQGTILGSQIAIFFLLALLLVALLFCVRYFYGKKVRPVQ
ncbi:MFS transporter [Enterococcus sp. HY326]|uniref:MFS transporter n=1 Tax=Enterococcus sp. HY326 TaxID=2971265 RepID=UPI00223F51AB|nr:MFS transporter [Enterococcus sp. HY326]